jgi:anti-sigma regulatory factor (Ser/Thr protein kinase)
MGRVADGGDRQSFPGMDRQSQPGAVASASAVFGDGEGVSFARGLARDFLREVQAVHGLPVSERAMDTVRLVVGELVTNARRHASGPCAPTLEVRDGAAEVIVVAQFDDDGAVRAAAERQVPSGAALPHPMPPRSARGPGA